MMIAREGSCRCASTGPFGARRKRIAEIHQGVVSDSCRLGPRRYGAPRSKTRNPEGSLEMNKVFSALIALAAVAVATPAFAQDNQAGPAVGGFRAELHSGWDNVNVEG